MRKGLHNASYKTRLDLPKCQVWGIVGGKRAAGVAILAQIPPFEVSNSDELLLTVLFLAGAFYGVYCLVDLWAGSPFRATVREAWADFKTARANRRKERRAWRDVDGLSARGLVLRIRDEWEAKQ